MSTVSKLSALVDKNTRQLGGYRTLQREDVKVKCPLEFSLIYIEEKRREEKRREEKRREEKRREEKRREEKREDTTRVEL